jgi:hypothetical protein
MYITFCIINYYYYSLNSHSITYSLVRSFIDSFIMHLVQTTHKLLLKPTALLFSVKYCIANSMSFNCQLILLHLFSPPVSSFYFLSVCSVCSVFTHTIFCCCYYSKSVIIVVVVLVLTQYMMISSCHVNVNHHSIYSYFFLLARKKRGKLKRKISIIISITYTFRMQVIIITLNCF